MSPKSSLLRILELIWLLGSAGSAEGAAGPTARDIDHALAGLTAVSGLSRKGTLRFQTVSRAETARYLEQRIAETESEKDIRLEETALKLFGLVPQSFDLRQSTLALMTEQAAAFYDYRQKKLFLADWTSVSLRDTAVLHELGHALADQQFHLERFLRKVQKDAEKSTARQAVVEGQASYLALAAADGGNHLHAFPFDPAGFDRAAEPSGQYPVFDNAPLYLRMSLVFPYTWGMAFQAAVVERLGAKGFAEIFRKPPVSTREVLHPDAYFSGESPAPQPKWRIPRGHKSLIDGSWGELDHRILIQQYVSVEEARRISPAWRACSFRIVERKLGGSQILLYRSEWQTADDAKSFVAVYRKCLAGKWKQMQVQKETPDAFSGRGDNGWFRVTRQGRRVESVEGWSEPF